jgi:hypothetical protein
MHSKAHTTLTVPFGLSLYKDLQIRYEKIIINDQIRNKPFLIVIYHSSLVKATMNAARVCKLRNGVKKTPQFLLFLLAKGGTKTIAHLSIAKGSSF